MPHPPPLFQSAALRNSRPAQRIDFEGDNPIGSGSATIPDGRLFASAPATATAAQSFPALQKPRAIRKSRAKPKNPLSAPPDNITAVAVLPPIPPTTTTPSLVSPVASPLPIGPLSNSSTLIPTTQQLAKRRRTAPQPRVIQTQIQRNAHIAELDYDGTSHRIFTEETWSKNTVKGYQSCMRDIRNYYTSSQERHQEQLTLFGDDRSWPDLQGALDLPPTQRSVALIHRFCLWKDSIGRATPGGSETIQDDLPGLIPVGWGSIEKARSAYAWHWKSQGVLATDWTQMEDGHYVGNPVMDPTFLAYFKALKKKRAKDKTRRQAAPITIPQMTHIMEYLKHKIDTGDWDKGPHSDEAPSRMLYAMIPLSFYLWMRGSEIRNLRREHVKLDTWDNRYPQIIFDEVSIELRKTNQYDKNKAGIYQVHRHKIANLEALNPHQPLRMWLDYVERINGFPLEPGHSLFPQISKLRSRVSFKVADGVSDSTYAAMLARLFDISGFINDNPYAEHTCHTFRRGAIQWWTSDSPLRLGFKAVKWYAGWGDGENEDILIRYLVNQAAASNDYYGDVFHPMNPGNRGTYNQLHGEQLDHVSRTEFLAMSHAMHAGMTAGFAEMSRTLQVVSEGMRQLEGAQSEQVLNNRAIAETLVQQRTELDRGMREIQRIASIQHLPLSNEQRLHNMLGVGGHSTSSYIAPVSRRDTLAEAPPMQPPTPRTPHQFLTATVSTVSPGTSHIAPFANIASDSIHLALEDVRPTTLPQEVTIVDVDASPPLPWVTHCGGQLPAMKTCRNGLYVWFHATNQGNRLPVSKWQISWAKQDHMAMQLNHYKMLYAGWQHVNGQSGWSEQNYKGFEAKWGPNIAAARSAIHAWRKATGQARTRAKRGVVTTDLDVIEL